MKGDAAMEDERRQDRGVFQDRQNSIGHFVQGLCAGTLLGATKQSALNTNVSRCME